MKKLLLLIGYLCLGEVLLAQNFEISGLQETYRGTIGEIIPASFRIKNTSDKPITLIIRKVETLIGSTQRSLLCPENNCLDAHYDESIIKIDAGQTLYTFSIGLDAGLAEGYSTIKYVVINKANPVESIPLNLHFAVEARPEKSHIYTSGAITIHDVYPNPVTGYANIDYKLHSEKTKTKIVIHNILGSPLKEYQLSPYENSVKLMLDDLNSGIYFYTLYIDNEGVLTRKLIVKK
jgi:hypothetical protein